MKQLKQFVWSSMWNSTAIHDHWGFTCQSSCETHVKCVWKYVWISSMWNSRSFAIQWGLNASDSPCETPFEVYVKICVNLHVSSMWNSFAIQWSLHVKACVKPHVKCLWKYVWKGWHRFTPFSHIFYYAKFHLHVKYVCEIHVKSVWKTCEKGVKIGQFSHGFYMMFHIHTPSSAISWPWKW